MLFLRPRRVGGLRKILLGGSGGQRGCWQLLPSQGWLTVASQVPQAPGLRWCFGIEAGPSSPCFPAAAHQASCLWPPPIPGCDCRAPREGRGGGTAGSEQRVPAQPSICVSCQRQTGMWGIWCMWGWGKQPGGQAGRRREAGAACRPVEPCRDTVSTQSFRHLLPVLGQ